jgi:hypothetical protein
MMARAGLMAGFAALSAFALGAVAPAWGEEGAAPSLSFPVACEFGKTCWIQSFVDIDTSAEVRDFACGSATYDGHNGTDFRVTSAAAAAEGVDVLASADGLVKGVRDGMVDIFATEANKASFANRECGNGVVVDHGGGWETQYCHMKQGSVVVQPGAQVKRGEKLGQIGFSGFAQFAHLHLSVRKGDAVIDPFSGQGQNQSCAKDGKVSGSLWDAAFRETFAYQNGEILESGFAGAVPDLAVVEATGAASAATATSPVLVFYARLMNLRKGDVLRMSATGPDGFDASNNAPPLDRNKATYLGFAGKKLKTARWPAGVYQGQVEVVRDGKVIETATSSVTFD